MNDVSIIKILRADELAELVVSGRFEGSADDRRDGFVHLSTDAQVPGTLTKHFHQIATLFLIYVKIGALEDALRWEVSRGGERFPHLYRPLVLSDVEAVVPVPQTRDGWQVPRLKLEV
ncbi:DUF952 domain-containing protein [Acuticoccus mangrovi]|uniref:DUF952 domain-containing protein n=1 Tax=Acuticoccus mangrovi TaxID=2796142 RepID=A0A934ITH2_9HYPH|nr:DUF952 domain-containing protein [Acuticoccus mangrovi]MBJ3777735.1 DUF952 domain-containing protein [Acuticoccus mangrovi]